MRVTFEYEAQDPFELTIKDGDIINIISEDQSGWFKGELNGVIGTFPSNFAEVYKEEGGHKSHLIVNLFRGGTSST